jgi:hypothetical protein
VVLAMGQQNGVRWRCRGGDKALSLTALDGPSARRTTLEGIQDSRNTDCRSLPAGIFQVRGTRKIQQCGDGPKIKRLRYCGIECAVVMRGLRAVTTPMLGLLCARCGSEEKGGCIQAACGRSRLLLAS